MKPYEPNNMIMQYLTIQNNIYLLLIVTNAILGNSKWQTQNQYHWVKALNSYFQLILISQFTEQDLYFMKLLTVYPVLIARILHFQLDSNAPTFFFPTKKQFTKNIKLVVVMIVG